MVEKDQAKKITRREALKALTAAGGAVMAGAMLPDKWAKPVIGSGVLPAHAQASVVFEIVDCQFYQTDSYPINSMAWINPIEKDISLTCEWIFQPYDNSVTTNGVLPSGTKTALTDEEGKAYAILDEYHWGEYPYGLFTFNWKFTNPLDGTDTCTCESVVD
jgi:hypothetical protein